MSLRETKPARTRLALLDAFVIRLDQRPIEEISVRELCAAVEVSEATFFNLFQGKAELITFFIQIWSLEMALHAHAVLAERGALAAIEAIYAATAVSVREHGRVMGEVLAAQARLDGPPPHRPLTRAERALRFPDRVVPPELPADGLGALLPWLLGEAVRRGELPAGVDLQFLFLNLAAVFFGTPMALRAIDPGLVGPAWQGQLALLWSTARRTGATT